MSEDTVCLSKTKSKDLNDFDPNDNNKSIDAKEDHCVEKFNFLDVVGQKGLGMLKVSGLVGLSPNKFEEEADLFVEKMKEVGAIEDAIFSMSIAPGNKQSKITFGGY